MFALAACSLNEDRPDEPDVPTPPVEEERYPETNLDDGKRKVAETLRVFDNGKNVIYFGDVFTAEGYDVYMVYYEYDNLADSSLPERTAIKLDKYTIDDSKVDYFKEGTYLVKITGRVRSDALTATVFVTIKADRYESLNQKHIYAIKCSERITAKVGTNKNSVVPAELYKVYTENVYENNELVLTEEILRSGYTLSGLDDIDFSKAGSYIVYVSYSETYGDTTITVKTFFTLVLEA